MERASIEAIVQLGVSESKAIEALTKFNGDVERAANFIYENLDNMFTDPEETPGLAPLGSDSQTSNWEDRGGGSVLGCFDRTNDSSSLENDRDMKTAMEASMADKENEDLQKAIDRSKTDSYAGALIPYNGGGYKQKDKSLTQPLFHIPVFRLSLLAFRPTKDDWGNVEGYWKGQKHYNYDDRSKFYSTNRQESLKFIHEFQKLFGFLSLSQRTYGDSNLLMEVLDFDEKIIWNEAEVVCNFTNKLINKLMEGSCYRNTGSLNIPINLQNYILDFEKLFRSNAENLDPKKYGEVANLISFKIYPSCLTVYDALDRVMQESGGNSRKPFFTQLAHILIMNLKHKDKDSNTCYPNFGGESTFQVLKELYMDRYMFENNEFIETCWQKIEIMKNELEKINQSIDKIIKFQGKYNGPDLLKGSIEHFQQKCKKAEEKGASDNNALQTKAWLENFLDKVEQKLHALLEKKDELEHKIRQMFDKPDMKKYHYRLKAVLVHNGQPGQGNYWAYIWVSRCSKSDTHNPSTIDNGNWMKFQDNTVEEVLEDVVLNKPGDFYSSHSVYTLFYVNAEVDYNFTNLEDVIPDSLKAFVEKDNQILEEEIGNEFRQVDAELPDSNAMDSTWESDSTACGGLSDSEKNIQARIDTITEQANNVKIYDAKILQRIEFFFVKLGQGDAIKSLMTEYLDSKSTAALDWSDPIPLVESYHRDSRYLKVIDAFNEFKEISQCIIEGLDQMIKKEYIRALGHFYKALELEESWLNQITFSSEFMVNVESLRRTNFIISYVKICLKAKRSELFEQAIRDATFVLKTFTVFVKNCRTDVLFNEFLQEWTSIQSLADKMHENLISELIREYISVIETNDGDESSPLFKYPDEIVMDSDPILCERYERLTWRCKEVFKKYNSPDPKS
ncbi:17314_t:CDS:10 [Dentiscutata heterogama]|uniref:17314_t:CDS:1 n=1 Tax=Dentiscutata heterogama TaxID=1316150 RepID=A0ACA9JYW1_9GLOM|nr:17314_t:CDS:10 [Dentiscutata heterogama]